MRWNIEKIFFVIGAAFFLLSLLGMTQTLILSNPLSGVELMDPESSSGGAVGGVVRVEWYESDPGLASRNPFQAISEWKSVPVGSLVSPPLGSLNRRVPLPPLFSGDAAAWLTFEKEVPEDIGSEEE